MPVIYNVIPFQNKSVQFYNLYVRTHCASLQSLEISHIFAFEKLEKMQLR